MVAVAAAGALVLSACGNSGSGTPTAASTPAATGASSAAQSSPDGGGTSAASEPAETSEEPTSAEPTESDEPSTSDDGPTTTLGGVADEATVTWFSTLCSGVGQTMDTSMTELGTAMSDSDPKAGQAKIVEILNKVGDEYSTTSSDLSALPPPSIDQGSEIAGKFVAALGKGGAAFKAAAAKIEAETITTAEELNTVVTSAMDEVSTAMDSMGDMDNLDITPELESQLKAIPACQTMFGGS